MICTQRAASFRLFTAKLCRRGRKIEKLKYENVLGIIRYNFSKMSVLF